MVFGGGSNASYDYLFGSRAGLFGRRERATNAVYKQLAAIFRGLAWLVFVNDGAERLA